MYLFIIAFGKTHAAQEVLLQTLFVFAQMERNVDVHLQKSSYFIIMRNTLNDFLWSQKLQCPFVLMLLDY